MTAALIRLSPTDNVAVAGGDIAVGAALVVGGLSLTTRQAIAAGHKVALADIPAGAAVVKYGEVIGAATQAIQAGEHVHLHNLRSLRDSPEAKKQWK
jgi:altronate hydrolase